MRARTFVLFGMLAAAQACGSNHDGSQRLEDQTPSPPRLVAYEVVEQWSIPNGGYGKAIVIKTADATEAQLRALGEELKFDTRADRNAFVFVFSDKRAAGMRGAAIRDALAKKDAKFYDDHFVAGYNRNGNTGNHTLTITPKGLNGPQIDVTY